MLLWVVGRFQEWEKNRLQGETENACFFLINSQKMTLK